MEKLNIIVWNIGKNTQINNIIMEYCIFYNIDVLVLIEDYIPEVELLSTLNSSSIGKKYHICKKNDRHITIYTSFNNELFETEKTKTNSNYINFVEFKFKTKKILFGGIHLSSKITLPIDYDRAALARDIMKEINELEKKIDNTNTIIVGDFNMNPFELGMYQYDAFNAVMSKDIATNNHRKIIGTGTNSCNLYQYFYNPMWSFMGDLSKYTPGTHYWYDNNRENNFRWNSYDQVLLRPCLIPNFVDESMKIIENDFAGIPLINSMTKTRSKKQIFDNLPIFLTLDLTK